MYRKMSEKPVVVHSFVPYFHVETDSLKQFDLAVRLAGMMVLGRKENHTRMMFAQKGGGLADTGEMNIADGYSMHSTNYFVGCIELGYPEMDEQSKRDTFWPREEVVESVDDLSVRVMQAIKNISYGQFVARCKEGEDQKRYNRNKIDHIGMGYGIWSRRIGHIFAPQFDIMLVHIFYPTEIVRLNNDGSIEALK